MSTSGLEPGLYLVGREDGTVEPFNVRTSGGCGSGCELHADTRGYITESMIQHALQNPGWWWRRVSIPNMLPEDLDTFPEAIDEWAQYPPGAGGRPHDGP